MAKTQAIFLNKKKDTRQLIRSPKELRSVEQPTPRRIAQSHREVFVHIQEVFLPLFERFTQHSRENTLRAVQFNKSGKFIFNSEIIFEIEITYDIFLEFIFPSCYLILKNIYFVF